MLNFQLLHNCVSCFAGLTAHTSLHLYAMHIMTYATYCQISVLNVTKIQYIYLLDETYIFVLYIHTDEFLLCRARACVFID